MPDRGISPELLQQLTLAILDRPAEEGLRMIKMVRSYLDTWETFLQDRHELVDHLRAAHNADPSCIESDPASLNRRHWEVHGSDLASFLGAHPVQG
jgi:uncharacterized NAD(P)/FAD-binding protein YdhS